MTIFIQVALAFVALAISSRISKYFKSFYPPLYIIMGILLGPLVLGWATDQDVFKLLGDIGLVFLMFYLGYEFSLRRVSNQTKQFLLTGLIDFVINFGLGILVGILLELSFLYIILIAGIIYMSSSSIITKSLIQLGAVKEKEGQLVMGIMVFEDFVMIAFIVLVAAFTSETQDAFIIAKEISIPLVFFFALLYFSRKYPALIDWIIGHRSHEVSHLGFMAIVLGVVGLGLFVGVKIALSGFLAGLMISQAETKEDFEPVVLKFRDIFGGVFFFYFGMTFTITAIPYSVGMVILIVAIAIVGKILSGVILYYYQGCSFQDALFIGIITVPRGEFSLIIAGLVISQMPEFLELSVIIVLATSLVTTLIFWIMNFTCKSFDICVLSNQFIKQQEDL